ncbi:MAG: hypothetical protein COA78_24340 [Blastopirellula sp.]|nr:MAG: hypothetical protein COA78_24340 [Blastopirellula sp.]
MSNLLQHKQVKAFTQSLVEKRWLWIGSTCLFTVAAIGYAMTKADKWDATQSLLIRDEVVGSYNAKGRFDSSDSMKAAQEMIVEVARSSEVIKRALKTVGPKENSSTADWPTLLDIEKLKGQVSVGSPHGTEFGTTEVIYLQVQSDTKERAVAFTDAITQELELAMKSLRTQRSASIIGELQNGIELSKTDLNTATTTLEQIEKQVGSDLGALRSLNDSSSGESNLQRSLTEIQSRLRAADSQHDTLVEQLVFLRAAIENPDQLIATPKQLLLSQTALRRLKDGLVDAQLRTSQLLGRMDEQHPLVRAARESELEVRQSLRKELEIAVRGVQADQKVNATQIQSYQDEETKVTDRMSALAGIRARYHNALADVEKCNTVYEQAFQELSDARAAQLAATSASLLTKMDGPVTGNYPSGPSKASIALLGMFGGLAFGLGLVVAITPIEEKFGRRLSDGFRGRRSSDSEQAGTARGGIEHRTRESDHPAQTLIVTRRESDSATDPSEKVPTELRGRTGNERRSDDRRTTGMPAIPEVAESQTADNPAAVLPPNLDSPATGASDQVNSTHR